MNEAVADPFFSKPGVLEVPGEEGGFKGRGRSKIERREEGREGGKEKKNKLERLTSVGRIGQLQLEGRSVAGCHAVVRPPEEEEAVKTLKEAQEWRGEADPALTLLTETRGRWGGAHYEKMPAGEAHSPSGIIPECF